MFFWDVHAKAAAINAQHRFHNRVACLRVCRHAGLSSKAWLVVCGQTNGKSAWAKMATVISIKNQSKGTFVDKVSFLDLPRVSSLKKSYGKSGGSIPGLGRQILDPYRYYVGAE